MQEGMPDFAGRDSRACKTTRQHALPLQAQHARTVAPSAAPRSARCCPAAPTSPAAPTQPGTQVELLHFSSCTCAWLSRAQGSPATQRQQGSSPQARRPLSPACLQHIHELRREERVAGDHVLHLLPAVAGRRLAGRQVLPVVRRRLDCFLLIRLAGAPLRLVVVGGLVVVGRVVAVRRGAGLAVAVTAVVGVFLAAAAVAVGVVGAAVVSVPAVGIVLPAGAGIPAGVLALPITVLRRAVGYTPVVLLPVGLVGRRGREGTAGGTWAAPRGGAKLLQGRRLQTTLGAQLCKDDSFVKCMGTKQTGAPASRTPGGRLAVAASPRPRQYVERSSG